jgi:flagellar protein FlbD
MIRLTRYAGRAPFVLNLATIAYIDETPDTHVTLISGERVHVRESAGEVIALALAWQRQILVAPVVSHQAGE